MTKRNQILAHLKSGRSITGLEALKLYGSFRLAAVIHSLRQDGYNITKENVKVGRSSGAPYARYHMGPK